MTYFIGFVAGLLVSGLIGFERHGRIVWPLVFRGRRITKARELKRVIVLHPNGQPIVDIGAAELLAVTEITEMVGDGVGVIRWG